VNNLKTARYRSEGKRQVETITRNEKLLTQSLKRFSAQGNKKGSNAFGCQQETAFSRRLILPIRKKKCKWKHISCKKCFNPRT
jgi:hypothetical protein